MTYNCKICNVEVEDNKHYFSTHRLSMKDYFETQEARKDLYTKELIPFTSPDNYLLADFVDKKNCQLYLDGLSVEKKKRYCSTLLLRRKEVKNLIYAPSQVELRSIIAPSIIYYNKLFGNYNKLCYELGFRNRFEYLGPTYKPPYNKPTDKKVKVLIDTREQKPLILDFPNKVGTLKYGDYALSDDKISDKVVVERKGLSDFISSFGSDIERLKNMLRRAMADNAYVVVVVESAIEKALRFDELDYVNKSVRATPQYVFHNVRDIMQNFSNVQFVFCGSREECEAAVYLSLFSGGEVRRKDLQLMKDYKGILKVN